jgi:Zn-dependent protease
MPEQKYLVTRALHVFLAEPPETPYDLRWSMLGIRVRVHPFFWLVSALLGWSWYEVGTVIGKVEAARGGGMGGLTGITFLLMWVGIVFVSILIHELGHVLVGWYFGAKGYVVLYMFGGIAVGSTRLRERWQRILVILAGPFAQLLLLGIVVGVLLVTIPGLASFVVFWLFGINPGLGSPVDFSPYVLFGLVMFAFINFYWPVLNLLPIYPLDGGQTTREICEGVSHREGTRFALGVSMVVAGLLAAIFFAGRQTNIPYLQHLHPVNGIFFAYLAFTNFQMMQAIVAQRRQWDDDHLPWER